MAGLMDDNSVDGSAAVDDQDPVRAALLRRQKKDIPESPADAVSSGFNNSTGSQGIKKAWSNLTSSND
jgi:hypothetical protein